ncbi:MAG: hypothetical protein ABI402_18420 [Ferruginibacter sp.]
MRCKLFNVSFAITFILLIQVASATTRTVCNYPLNVAQYNDIQSAIDASNAGDTILVQGSVVTYETAIIQDKRLTLIGPGWSPVRNTAPLTAKVKRITINGTASSGSEIQGFVFTEGSYTGVTTEQNVTINDLRIIRNDFEYLSLNIADGFLNGNGEAYCSGYVIEGNYFHNCNVFLEFNNHLANSIIRNNLFLRSNILDFALCNNVIVDHNIFYNDLDNLSIPALSICTSLTVQNNIFCKMECGGDNTTDHCTFKNNITFGTSSIPAWTLNFNSDGGGNILGQNPNMVDQVSVNNGTDNPLLNFTIASGPANNSGSDGKDMGLLYDPTGSLNWNNSRTSRLPYVFNVNIANNTIDPNATLNVTIEARRNN